MKSLRVRLTLWFTLGFVFVAAIFMVFTYHYLDLRLRQDTFQRENKINPNWILQGSYSEQEVQAIMAEVLQSSLIISLPLLLVVLALGYFIARQSLRPIESLNQQLKSVSPATLGKKIQMPEADEQFRSLEDHLNEMLVRLQRSFHEITEYAAKVAHELRTPLTILRHKIEHSRGRIEPELAEELQEELHRLTHVVEQSLLIARAEQGRLNWNLQRFDLSAMLIELVKDFHLLANADGRSLQLEAASGCEVEIDERYCKQILHTLLTNALIHGIGEIKIRLIERQTRVRLAIVNRVASKPTPSELTLGLGLRVVKALVARQTNLQFRQHHGSHFHATCLSLPKVLGAHSVRLAATAKKCQIAAG